MTAVRVQGCHATVFVLTQSASSSSQSFHHGLVKFVESCQSCLVGLETCYTAIVTTTNLKKVLSQTKHKLGLGKWHCLTSSAHQTPTSAKRRRYGSHSGGPRFDFTALERTISALSNMDLGCLGENEDEDETLSDVATRMHSLLNKAPWSSNAHVLMDIHWFAGEEKPLASPNTAIALFGALLRASRWHQAHIDIVTSSNAMNSDRSLLCWREALEGVSVTSLDGWRPLHGVIWRGAMHFTEHKIPKQATHQSVAFPGFTLALASDLGSGLLDCGIGCSTEDLLDGVGLRSSTQDRHSSTEQFSHLELLQVIDTSSIPLFWISPLQCTLSLNATANPASLRLFKKLLASDSTKCAGLLLCLCYSEHSATPAGSKHRSTSDWLACLQDDDLTSTQDSVPFPLAAYNTGPLLLVCRSDDQSDCNMQSCDAWFLWRPEAIDAGIFAQLKHTNMQIASDQGVCGDLLEGLSLVDIASQDTSVRELFASEQGSFLPCEEELLEVSAMQTHEWLQRKMIHRITTPELMFGMMVAPPPIATTTDTFTAGDILSCFTETGSPTVEEMSPIAMRDPSAITRVHVPVDTDVSYGNIVASTPTSKKKYHGISYCWSQEDSAFDMRLTRIQQSCLASERHSNCSSVNSPRAQRSHRHRPSQVPLKTEASKDVTNPTSSGAATKPKPKPSVLHPQLRVMKSPVVRISRVRESGKGRSVGGKVAKLKRVKLEISTPPESLLSKTSSNSELATTHSRASVTRGSRQKTSTSIKSSHEPVNDVPTDPPHKTTPPHATALSTLRRSPRTNKWKIPSKEKAMASSSIPPGGEDSLGDGAAAPASDRDSKRASGGKGEYKPRKEKKKLLEDLVVTALKRKGMKRSHVCFRNCYKRLYYLSKSFLKDLKAADTTLTREIEKVVEFNVRQVIEFELRITGNPSIW